MADEDLKKADQKTQALTEADAQMLQEELEEMKLKAEEYLNGWKRALADYQNYKKDSERSMQELREFSVINIIEELLPTFDTLELTIQHIPEELRTAAWYQGIEHMRLQWIRFLKDRGITRIEDLGKPFDPNIHEAIETAIDPEQADNTILTVQLIGYAMQNKVIRPAKVIVNKVSE